MKANVWDQVRLLVDVPGQMSDRDVIPAGTLGAVIEMYESPSEGYAVDVAVPDADSVTGYEYDNVLLTPDQFVVVMRYVENEAVATQAG